MSCRETEYAILEGQIGPGHQAHLAHCEACRQFLAAQEEIDALCQRAFAVPQLSAAFHRRLNASIRRERARSVLTWLPGAAGLAATAVCIAVLPDFAGWVARAGVGATLLAYLGSLAFDWLTEELGEA